MEEQFDLRSRLIDKSVEAYILALETINRLTIKYRVETFCYLMCNSWELLLKAKIIADSGDEASIYRASRPDSPRMTLTLGDCLNKLMPDSRDTTRAIRRNIERISELRNESVHLTISQIPRDLIGLFQASVINYHKYLSEWFGKSLSDHAPVGMMSIVYDLSPERSDLNGSQMRKELGEDAFAFLSQYCADINREFDELQRPPEFSIGVEYRLALVKNPSQADIVLSQGTTGIEPTQIVQIPKDPSISHPHRQTEILKIAVDAGLEINSHDIKCVNKIYQIKTRPEYFYQGKVQNSPGQYSQSFVDWLMSQYQRDNQFFTKARERAKNET